MKYNLPIFFFMDCTPGGVSKNSLLNTGSLRFSPVLPSRSFIILYFAIRYTIHIELIFVKGIMSMSRFTSFYRCQILSAPLVEKTILFLIKFLCSFVKDQLTTIWVYIWDLYSVSLVYMSLLPPIPCCLDYCSFIVSLDVGWYQSSDSVPKYYAGYFGSSPPTLT